MEEHSSLSTSGEEAIYTLEGCSEINPIAMIKNKYGNIVYVGNIKKFTALPGANGKDYAVRVTSVIREE